MDPRAARFALRHALPASARTLAAWSSRTAAAFADGLLPRCCALCTLPLAGQDERSVGWCAPCAASLPGVNRLRCPMCALPMPAAIPVAGHLAPSCPACLVSPPPFDRTIALADYAPPLDRLILALKFHRAVALARPLGAALAMRIDCPLDLLVPVPLSAPRLAERGFNQSLLIGRAITRLRPFALDYRTLQRARHDPPQSLQPLHRREPNLRGAFTCTRSLAGLRVGVVDDVMTSGATLADAARALKHAGAAFVATIVAARTAGQ